MTKRFEDFVKSEIKHHKSLFDLLLDEKIEKQQLLNKSLEITIKKAKDKLKDAKDAIQEADELFKQYANKNYIIPQSYRDEYLGWKEKVLIK